MSWLSKLMPSGIRTENAANRKRSVPEGLWEKCDRCGAVLYRPELEENLEVCPKCGHHMAIRARARLASLFDADSTKAVLITPHDNYAAPSITTKNAELTDIINEELESIYTGQKTVEEGLKSAKTRGDAALAG